MKEIKLVVDDDVEYIEIQRYLNIEKAETVMSVYEEGYNELDIWNVKIHRNKNKKSNLVNAVYIALPTKIEKK